MSSVFDRTNSSFFFPAVTESKDFFISYTGADVRWAEWIAWLLEENGYAVEIQSWDFRVGEDFSKNMDLALRGCRKTVAVLSPAYFASRYCQMELKAALKDNKLLPVCIQVFGENKLIDSIAYLDLAGKTPEDTSEIILQKIADSESRGKPKVAPSPPEIDKLKITEPIHFPGKEPEIWNIPFRRNPYFTGRDEILESLYHDLQLGQSNAPIKVLSGLGGVGKTQIAIEYAYRYRSDYDIIWHIRSEKPVTLAADFAALARALDLPAKEEQEQAKEIEAVKHALREREGWLLIFDNVELEEDVWDFLPQAGAGQVIITSRSGIWNRLEISEIRPLKRNDSVNFLIGRTEQNSETDAAKLAELFGDLPLALEQAGAFIKATGMPVAEYIELFNSNRKDVWAVEEKQRILDYNATVATTWDLSMRNIQKEVPISLDLMRFFAFLAPENIPRALLELLSNQIKDAKKNLFSNRVEVLEAINVLRRYSFIEVNGDYFSLHRLVQLVTREKTSENEQRMWSEVTIRVIKNVWPESSSYHHDQWSLCEEYFSHARIASDHAVLYDIKSEETAKLAEGIGWYLEGIAAFNEAVPFFQRAIIINEFLYGESHVTTINSYNNLAGLYGALGKFPEAEELYLKILTLIDNIPETNSTLLGTINNDLGLLYKYMGRYDEAEEFYRRSLEIRIEDEKQYLKHQAMTYHNLAMLHKIRKQFEEAEAAELKALEIRKELLGEKDRDTAASYDCLAGIYDDQGRYDEAEPLFLKALNICISVLGENHSDTASTYNNLAKLYFNQENYDESEANFRKTLAIYKETLGENHPHTAVTYYNLARLLEKSERYDEASPLYQRAIEIGEEALGDDHPHTVLFRKKLGAMLEIVASNKEEIIKASGWRHKELLDFVKSLEGDFTAFYEKGNKAAGTRVRKAMQDLKKIAQDIRVEVQKKKSA